MTGEDGRPVHEHREVRPHDDTHHVVAAFTVLLLERGAQTTEDLSARLAKLQVVHGRLEPASLAAIVRDLERQELIAPRETTDETSMAYDVLPAGRALVDDWVAIMRDRRRLSRTFLALYDRTDE